MNVPAPPVFRPDEFPDAEPRMLELLSVGFRDINTALAQVPGRAIKAGVFTSEASGVTTVIVANPLSTKPQHVSLALRRDDLADFSAAWSWWFVMSGAQISLKFIGLPASVKHVYSLEVA